MAATYIQGLASARSPAVRQGSAAALRVLPYRLLQPHWRAALTALGQASQVGRCSPANSIHPRSGISGACTVWKCNELH